MLFDTVKNLCLAHKVTIAELERGINVGNGTIRKWNISSPSVDKLEAVANYFGVSTDFLLGRGCVSKQAIDLAKIIDDLSTEKQELIRCYVKVIQKEGGT